MPEKYPELTDDMSLEEISNVLRSLIFTTSHNRRRAVYMSSDARDAIVAAIDRWMG